LICDQCGSPLSGSPRSRLLQRARISAQLTIDTSALETSYHDLGRKIHPTTSPRAAPMSRDEPLGTALLTAAIARLRDPIARGLYWLELNGEKLAENNKNVPPELAETVFEVQEQLAESARRQWRCRNRASARSRESAAPRISSTMMTSAAISIRNFSRWDASPDNDTNAKKALVSELKTILSKNRILTNFASAISIADWKP